jgi:hypothetical protein
MPRCFLTGLEMELQSAYVLDVGTALRAVRELQGHVARLKRLVEQLGPIDVVKVPNFNGKGTSVRRHRRLVSPTVAEALNGAGTGHDLFVSWTAWCSRGRILPLLALRSDPDHGPRVRRLSTQDMQRLVALADEVLERMAPGIHLSFEVRNALVAGVCTVLRDNSADEVVEILCDRLRRGQSLDDLGVPFGVEPAFRGALASACQQPWALPASTQPPGEIP